MGNKRTPQCQAVCYAAHVAQAQGIHNLIQIDGLVWLPGDCVRIAHTQASGWRKIEHGIMYAGWSRDHYLLSLHCLQHVLYLRTTPICIYSTCLHVSSHCELVGVVFFVRVQDCLHSLEATIPPVRCDLQSFGRVHPNLYHSQCRHSAF